MDKMHRIVHFDLKGAPWKVHYLEQVILMAKKWGATGILFEWEDTFPYIGDLVEIGSLAGSSKDDMYYVDEVQHLMTFVKNNGLEPIQLIQTIGHMEFVLKHPMFENLREYQRSAAVLCPTQENSLHLVRMMLLQALDLQPDAKYLHIGADEVWHSGICTECKQRAEASKYNKACLFLDHIRDLVVFLKEERPNLTVLMWDDMLRSISVDVLKEYKFGELVEPVVWHYNAKDTFNIDPNLWENYRQVFPKVWGGSAYKGANGSCRIVSPVSRYASNHDAWIDEIKKYESHVNFAGMILTGWSRYDHYATFCELLPVSLPSLASCLKLLTNRNNNVGTEMLVNDFLPLDQWPGEELARNIREFTGVRQRAIEFINGDLVTTWLNPWQLKNNYTHPVQVEGIGTAADQFISELHYILENITVLLLDITGQRSIDEWIHTFGRTHLNRLYEIRNSVENRMQLEPGVQPASLIKEMHPYLTNMNAQLESICGNRSTDEWMFTFARLLFTKLIELRNLAESRAEMNAGVSPTFMPPRHVNQLFDQL